MTETIEQRAARIAEFRRTNPSPEEINAILGPSWGICRATPRNLERYSRCITKREYDAALKEALRRRLPR